MSSNPSQETTDPTRTPSNQPVDPLSSFVSSQMSAMFGEFSKNLTSFVASSLDGYHKREKTTLQFYESHLLSQMILPHSQPSVQLFESLALKVLHGEHVRTQLVAAHAIRKKKQARCLARIFVSWKKYSSDSLQSKNRKDREENIHRLKSRFEEKVDEKEREKIALLEEISSIKRERDRFKLAIMTIIGDEDKDSKSQLSQFKSNPYREVPSEEQSASEDRKEVPVKDDSHKSHGDKLLPRREITRRNEMDNDSKSREIWRYTEEADEFDFDEKPETEEEKAASSDRNSAEHIPKDKLPPKPASSVLPRFKPPPSKEEVHTPKRVTPVKKGYIDLKKTAGQLKNTPLPKKSGQK